MKPLMQTTFGCPGGNCMQACIASLLEVPITEVPDFCNMHPWELWHERLASWLDLKHGMGTLYNADVSKSLGNVTGYCILGVNPVGRDPKNIWLHAVVGEARRNRAGTLMLTPVHDPYPGGIMGEIRDSLFFVRNAV